MTSVGVPHQNQNSDTTTTTTTTIDDDTRTRTRTRNSTPHRPAVDAKVTRPLLLPQKGDPGSQQPLMTSGADTNADARPPLADLPEELIVVLPTLSEPLSSSSEVTAKGKKRPYSRFVFVGDVHGHLAALQALLAKVEFDHTNGDHLVFVGDIIAKGPDSAGVVKLAMDVGASGVRGNHEDKVLRAHKAMQRKKKHHKEIRDLSDAELQVLDDLESATLDKHEKHARAIARSLSAKQIKWLSSLPVLLRIGGIPGATANDTPWDAGEIVVVHAGLVPSTPLELQDPWAMMNMRTLLYPGVKYASELSEGEEAGSVPDETSDEVGDATTAGHPVVAVPSDTRQGEPWSHAWNRYQNTVLPSAPDRTVVIYGHDARVGLQADVSVTIRPNPAERGGNKKQKKHHTAKSKRGDDPSGIYVEVAPEVEVENDGDVEVEVETEIEIESTQTSGNSTNESSADKLRKRVEDLELSEEEEEGELGAAGRKHKKHRKNKKQKGTRYAFGIDTGCGHGRQLTALVLELVTESPGPPKEERRVVHHIQQVDCEEYEK